MRALAMAKQRSIVATLAMLALVGAAGMAAAQAGEEGVANFYSDKLQGKKMASGEIYDKDKLTASHKKLPPWNQGQGDEPREPEKRCRHDQRSNGRLEPGGHRCHEAGGRGARFREVRQDQGQAGGREVTSHHPFEKRLFRCAT